MNGSNKKEIIIVDDFYLNANNQNIDDCNIQKKTNEAFSNLSVKIDSPEFNCFCECTFNNNEIIGKVNIRIADFIFYIFTDAQNKTKVAFNIDFFCFSLLNIKRFESSNKTNKIEIVTKDYRYFTFKFPNKKDFENIYDILSIYSYPLLTKDFKNYAFWYKTKFKEGKINGWNIYNLEEEFTEQGLNLKDNKKFILFQNNYKICESYPKQFIIPSYLNEDDIMKCGKYRTKKRLPVLTYFYKKNGCSIWRSSQPKPKFGLKISDKDVELLKKIAGIKNLIIFDARPKLNAIANSLKGAGFENVNNYPDISMEIEFCGMSNIHDVRNSLKQFYLNIIYNREIKTIDNSLWYDSIIIMIKSAEKIYKCIKNDSIVLIHCSDGWDRTSQLCALSQIFLDKRYRTINGFIKLIEKDWLSFGHLFCYRYGYYNQNNAEQKFSKEEQRSPIFIQWLDAVYQIVNQNTEKFEFNIKLLIFLAEEVNNGKYGTFLYNNEKDREINFAKEKTVSIWSEIKKNEYIYINPIYKDDNNPIAINYKRINIWSDFFYRFEKNKQDHIYLNNQKIKEIEQKNLKLQNKVDYTEKQLNYKSNLINELKSKNKLNEKIIQEFATLINNSNIDTSNLSKEAQKALKENLQFDNSFEIINKDENSNITIDTLSKKGFITKNIDLDPLSENKKK